MSSKLTTLEKYTFILKEFNKRLDRTLDAYDQHLQDALGLGYRQIERILDELAIEYSNIEKIKIGRKKAFKLIKPIDILEEALNEQTDIGWLFSMVHEADPETFKKLENYTDKNKSIYKFVNTPFEDLSTLEEKDTFKKLRRAVENREYIKLKFSYSDEIYDNLKCLKLIFIDNNWYIAYVNPEDILRLGRISFIQKVDYASKIESFQLSKVEKHISFLEHDLQNSMTLYNVKPKKAILKATNKISIYFEKDMKKFFLTQKFIEKTKDESIIFSIEYTQELEILPFIQKWIPDLIILEPQELKDNYLTKIKSIFDNYSN